MTWSMREIEHEWIYVYMTHWKLWPLSATVCQSVSVTMTDQQQQQGILNSLVHKATHRDFTCWQTEPRAVLSAAHHSLQRYTLTLLLSSPHRTQKSLCGRILLIERLIPAKTARVRKWRLEDGKIWGQKGSSWNGTYFCQPRDNMINL